MCLNTIFWHWKMCINQQKLHFKTQTQAKNKHSIYKIALVFILKNGVKNSVTHCFCPWNTSSIISINWRENVTQKLLKGGKQNVTFVSSVTVPFFRDTTTTIQFPHKGLFREGMRKPRNTGPQKGSSKMFETKKSSEIILFCKWCVKIR